MKFIAFTTAREEMTPAPTAARKLKEPSATNVPAVTATAARTVPQLHPQHETGWRLFCSFVLSQNLSLRGAWHF